MIFKLQLVSLKTRACSFSLGSLMTFELVKHDHGFGSPREPHKLPGRLYAI